MKSDAALEKIKKSSSYRSSEMNQEDVSFFEKRIESLRTDEAFLKIDQVQSMRESIKKLLVSYRKRLIEEDDPVKRSFLKARVAAYSWVLSWVSKNVDHELEEIEGTLSEWAEGV